jgi:UDP-3-O-[3-hydroxymyristoyl] glucosamine N-acyltransferase
MTLSELAEALGCELVGGRQDAEVLGVSGLDAPAAGHIGYAEDARRLQEAERTPLLAIIAPPDAVSDAKPLLRVRNPRLAYARAIGLLYPEPRLSPGVHPSAHLGVGVELGREVAIGPLACIESGARIGDRVQIHPLAVVGAGARVGDDSVLFPHATVCRGVTIGARVILHPGAVVGSDGFGFAQDGERPVRVPHVGTVIIGDDVEIGANACVDRATTGATVIGSGTKIDNLVQVAHNVRIGRNCLLAGQVGLSGSVTVGDGVMMGGQAGVADHLRIGDHSVVAARSGLIGDVPPGAFFMGLPARPRSERLRIDVALLHLPELARTVRDLERRIAELEERLEETSG